MQTTAQLRTALRNARRQIEPADAVEAANAAAQLLVGDQRVRTARVVGAYVAFDGELDPAPALAELRQEGASIAVAVLADEGLVFRRIDEETAWTLNRYGISEPAASEADDDLSAGQLDVVIVPAVAVDPNGNRVGMGAGWYDRTFADATTRPMLIAFVHDLQVCDRLDAQPHDVAMDAIVTPTRWIEAVSATL